MEVFRDLLMLLRGNVPSGELAAQAIVDLAAESTDASSLNLLLHELCTDFLVAAEWSTRVNAAYALRLLCARFRVPLSETLLHSPSDGDLLQLHHLQVGRICALGDSALLLSGTSNYLAEAQLDRLYSRNWLARQQRALAQRLGIEADMGLGAEGGARVSMSGLSALPLLPMSMAAPISSSSSFSAAAAAPLDMRHEVLGCGTLTREDVEVRGGEAPAAVDRRATLLGAAGSSSSGNDGTSSSSSGNKRFRPGRDPAPEMPSRERPFARLVRFLVAGLLDPRWETRHGCAVGLCGVVNGLCAWEVVKDYSAGGPGDREGFGEGQGGGKGGAEGGRVGVGVEERGIDAVPAWPGPSPLHPPSAGPSPTPPPNTLPPQPPPLPLPPHLLEDILCTGACVLVLDRFIDFSQHTGRVRVRVRGLTVAHRHSDLGFSHAHSCS